MQPIIVENVAKTAWPEGRSEVDFHVNDVTERIVVIGGDLDEAHGSIEGGGRDKALQGVQSHRRVALFARRIDDGLGEFRPAPNPCHDGLT